MKKLLLVALVAGLFSPTLSWGAEIGDVLAEADSGFTEGIRDGLRGLEDEVKDIESLVSETAEEIEKTASYKAFLESLPKDLDPAIAKSIARRMAQKLAQKMVVKLRLKGPLTRASFKSGFKDMSPDEIDDSLSEALTDEETAAIKALGDERKAALDALEDMRADEPAYYAQRVDEINAEFEAKTAKITAKFQDIRELQESLFNLLRSTPRLNIALQGASKMVADVVAQLNPAAQQATKSLTRRALEGIGRKIAKPFQALGRTGAGKWVTRRFEDAARDTQHVEDVQATIKQLNKEQDRLNANVRVGVDGKAEITNTAFTSDTSFLLGDARSALRNTVGKNLDKKLENADVRVEEDGEDINVTVTLRKADGTFVEVRFKVKNPSEMEKKLLTTKPLNGKFTITKYGRLSFKSDNVDLSSEAKQLIEQNKVRLKGLEEDLQAAIAARGRSETIFHTIWRGIKSFFKMIGNIIRHPGQTLEKLYHGLMETGKMMAQGVFFGVPSMIYQAMMQEAQRQALFMSITAPVPVGGGLILQIPAQLIPASNPQSGTFLYVAVPSGTPTPYTMSASFLQSASYYVVYQNNYPWGTTYAGSPNGGSGMWVNLNTGLIFQGEAQPCNPQMPCAFLLQPLSPNQVEQTLQIQGTLSVQNYVEQASGNVATERNVYTFNQSWLDVDPGAIEATKVPLTPDPTIKKLFESVQSSAASNNAMVANVTEVYPPRLLIPTLNLFRQGIKNVPGFLPPSATSSLPTISIKQFEGTGILNKLLGNPSSTNSSSNAQKAYELVFAVQKQSQALANAQLQLAQALADQNATDTQISAITETINDARNAFTFAFSNLTFSAGATEGMNVTYDVNGYGIYLYETEDTPIAQFLQEQRPSPLIPAKDYVVFMDMNSNVVPLFETVLQTNAQGITTVVLDNTKINGSIQYMCSLVTGLTYVFNESGAGEILKAQGGIQPDTSMALTAASQLFQTVALVLYGTATSTAQNNVLNQVAAMANYATNLAHQGPFYRGGYLFTRVNLSSMNSQLSTQTEIAQNFGSGLNGQSVSLSKNSTSQYPFGPLASVATRATWLDDLYIYQVSGTTPLKSGPPVEYVGCFGQDANGDPIYDYVVPLTVNASGSYQILPLGLSEAVGDAFGVSSVHALASLVTGKMYDRKYQLLSNPPSSATVIKRDPDFNIIEAQPGEYSVGWQVASTNAAGTTTTSTVQVAAVPGLPLATAFMPTFCNPYNVILTSILENGTTSDQYNNDSALVAAAQKNLTAATSAVTEAISEQASLWKVLREKAATGDEEGLEKAFATLTTQAGLMTPYQVDAITQWMDMQRTLVPIEQLVRKDAAAAHVWAMVQDAYSTGGPQAATKALASSRQLENSSLWSAITAWIRTVQNLLEAPVVRLVARTAALEGIWQQIQRAYSTGGASAAQEVLTTQSASLTKEEGDLFEQWISQTSKQGSKQQQSIMVRLENAVQDSFGQERFIPEIWNYLQRIYAQEGATSALKSLDNVANYLTPALQKAMKAWVPAKSALVQAISALSADISAQQESIAPQSYSVPKPSDQLLNVPPMYWMHFANYVYATVTATQYQAPIMLPNQQTVQGNLNWLNIVPSANASFFTNPAGGNYALGQALPGAFIEQVQRAFLGWQEVESMQDIVAQTMQAGPFRFSNGILYNVFLTIQPQNYKTGNFFYNLVPVFEPTQLFALGELSSTVYTALQTAIINKTSYAAAYASPGSSASSSTASATASSASATPAPIELAKFTVSDLNSNDHLGMSFYDVSRQQMVIINVATGEVWMPTPSSVSSGQYSYQSGFVSKAMCNITKVGTVDPQELLTTVFENQYTGKGSPQTLNDYLNELQTANPILYSSIQNSRSVVAAQAEATMYPVYFAGRTLRLSPKAISNGTFIYAVVDSKDQDYLKAKGTPGAPGYIPAPNDYWVAAEELVDDQGHSYFRPSLQQVSTQTAYMISLVTYNVYKPTDFTLPSYQLVSLASGAATSNTPALLFDEYFGSEMYAAYAGSFGSSKVGYLSAVKTTYPDLYNRIEDLVMAQNGSFINAHVANATSGTGVVAAPLPTTLTLVTSSNFSNLYQDSAGKYYVYIPGQDGASTYIYDFNAGIADPVPNGDGSWTYSVKAGNPKRGVYYLVPPSSLTLPTPTTPPTSPATLTLSSSGIIPAIEVTGYAWQAMAIKFGISINEAGIESISMPVFNPPLPMTSVDAALAPGQSSPVGQGYMQCVLQPDTTKTQAVTNDFVDYYYFNSASQMYLARRTLSTQYPVVVNPTTHFTALYTPPALDYYVDLVTGERYNTNGDPYLTEVTVAYYVPQPTTGTLNYPVANSVLDYSNPLFIWGSLDMFGEASQLSMMYQNTDQQNPNDPYNGYNVYQLQPYSTTFTMWLPGGSAGEGTATIYGYSATESDSDGNPYITTTVGTTTMTTTETDMSAVLLKVLNSGSFLLAKSYTMNLNGASVAVGTTTSAIVTVTESSIAPKQYQISYTDSMSNSITDIFQMPVALDVSAGASSTDVGGAPGASPNDYNYPPLDAQLQLELLQGVPFCAKIIGSRPYTTKTAPVSGSSVGTNGIICGILSKPPAGSYISASGLLGVTFSGANGNTVPAMNNQFFAFYGSYNNTPLYTLPTTASNPTPRTVASRQEASPEKGSYAPYSSVAASMSNNYTAGMAYPGLYAGNFTHAVSGAATTYVKTEAPYLCITPLPICSTPVTQSSPATPGTTYQNTDQSVITTINECAVPPTSSSTEYVYGYLYSTASSAVLSKLTEYVGISTNAQGFRSLVSALETIRGVNVDFAMSSIAGSTPTQISNPQAEAILKQNVVYGFPKKSIQGAASVRYLYKLNCSNTDPVSKEICTQIDLPGQVYVDIYNGTVFEETSIVNAQGNKETLIYPAGYCLSGSLLTTITQAIGGAVPKEGAVATLVIQAPGMPSGSSTA